MSSTAPRRRLPAAERRSRIVAEAYAVFAARGYQATSMREIAEAVGVTKPVLYAHFASKRALFAALMEEASAELLSRAGAAMAQPGTLETRVRTMVAAFLDFVADRPDAARVLLVLHRGDAELERDSQRVQAAVSARGAELLAAEPDLLRGAPDRPQRLAAVVEFAKQGLHGVAEWWTEHPEVPRATVEAVAEELVWGAVSSQLDGGGPAADPA